MSDKSEIILYQDEEGDYQIPVYFSDNTPWLSILQISKLFQMPCEIIEKEIEYGIVHSFIEAWDVIRFMRILSKENSTHKITLDAYYNLDVIILVGYFGNGIIPNGLSIAMKFRDWALKIIEEQATVQYHKRLKLLMESLAAALKSAEHTDNNLEQFVYLLKSSMGIYKIGRTKSPDERLKALATLPFEVEYVWLHSTHDMVKLEKQLHQRFADKRVNGEWFALNETDVQTFIHWNTDLVIHK